MIDSNNKISYGTADKKSDEKTKIENVVSKINQFLETRKIIIDAAQNGDLKIIKKLINSKANLNLVDQEGNSALIIAVKNGSLEIAKELINAQANLKLVNIEGDCAIEIAAQRGDFKIVKELVEAGDQKIDEGLMALKFDYEEGKNYPEEIKKLFKGEIKILLKSASNLEEIIKNNLRFNKTKPKEFDIYNLQEIISVLEVDKPFTSSRFDFLSEINEYCPLISRILLKAENPEVLRLFSDKLDLFINEKSLNKKDSAGKTPLEIVIEKTATTNGEVQDLLTEISAKINKALMTQETKSEKPTAIVKSPEKTQLESKAEGIEQY